MPNQRGLIARLTNHFVLGFFLAQTTLNLLQR